MNKALILCAALALLGRASAQTAAFPVTLKHGLGQTTIPAAPKRIVALSTEDVDTLLALGITPLAGVGNYIDNLPFPWEPQLGGKLQPFPPFSDLSLEKIAALKPDLILATSRYGVGGIYKQLSGIAPTLVYVKGDSGARWGTDAWQERLLLIGQAVGREAQAKAVLAQTQAKIDTFKREFPKMAGKTYSVSVVYTADGKTDTVVGAENPNLRFLGQLGLRRSPKLQPLVKPGETTANLSLEQLSLLDADLVLLGYSDPSFQAPFEKNPLFQRIPAVQQGHDLSLSLDQASAFKLVTPLSIPWLLDSLKPGFAKLGWK